YISGIGGLVILLALGGWILYIKLHKNYCPGLHGSEYDSCAQLVAGESHGSQVKNPELNMSACEEFLSPKRLKASEALPEDLDSVVEETDVEYINGYLAKMHPGAGLQCQVMEGKGRTLTR
ncbi:hypothetical protein FOZ63_010050, partial [Perkinsus olseni]